MDSFTWTYQCWIDLPGAMSSRDELWERGNPMLSDDIYTYLFIYIYFHHTTCESTCGTLPSSATNQGDNTVSVAQGSTATPGASKQLLPLDRVCKRNIYIYIYIYIYKYARSAKSRDYIGCSFMFIFSAVWDFKMCLLSAVDGIATVSWCCVIIYIYIYIYREREVNIIIKQQYIYIYIYNHYQCLLTVQIPSTISLFLTVARWSFTWLLVKRKQLQPVFELRLSLP